MLRRDSSTKFGPGNKVGYFPSFTAGWIFLMKVFWRYKGGEFHEIKS
jgi:hypothetical protein